MRRISIPTYLFSLLLLLVTSCNQEAGKQEEVSVFEDYKWMAGTWNSTDDPGVYEIWTLDGEMLSGLSMQVWQGDTNILERMEITENEGLFQLEVFLSDTAESTIFPMSVREANRMHFTNPQHDFPKEIIYSKLGLNSLRAEIKGNGKKQRFLFVRR